MRSSSRPTFTDLLTNGHILGVIDNYGAIHSRYTPFGDPDYRLMHGDIWPGVHHKRWRWTHDAGLRLSCVGETLEMGEADDVRAHITKRFGLLWWENGFHDIHHLLAKARGEGWGG